MKFKDEKQYIGHVDQIFKVKHIKLQDGKANGVTMIQVHNSSGMNFDINMDRGMDIPYLDFKGQNIGFVSPCGIVSPQYFDDKGLGFLKSFTAGFLTTCGLKHVGNPCEYDGQSYGLHGNLSHIPVEQFSYEIVEDKEEIPYLEIKGKVTDAMIFGDKISLARAIKCYYKEKKFTISDIVTNDGFKKVRHMILYHMNIGYPILSPDSEVYIPFVEVKPRNEHSKSGIDSWNKLQLPDADYKEMCYYHTFKGDKENIATVAIYNSKLEIGIAIDIDVSTLDHFVQWKMMGKGEYVMGLEPGNVTIDGIEDAITNGSMKYLKAGESFRYYLNVKIIEGKEEFESIKK